MCWLHTSPHYRICQVEEKSKMPILGKRKRQGLYQGKRQRKLKRRSPYGGRSKTGSVVRAGRVTGLSRSDFGFPDLLKTKLHYCDVVQLTASAGSPGLWQFRMNSLFDPDFTGTGHQPQWFDQLAAVYQRYRVLGAKITAKFIPNTINSAEVGDTGPYIVGITTKVGSTFAAATYAAILEDGNSINDIVVDKQGGNNLKVLSNTYSPMRDTGLDPYDDTLGALVSANPTTQYFATVWAMDISESVAPDVQCQIEIEFACEFSWRNENVNS